MNIDTTNSLIRKNLQLIARIIIENGGGIHSGITIHHKKANLWISCENAKSDTPLFAIPNALFVPVSNLTWHGHNGILAYEGSIDHLTGNQQQLLAAMLTIYNESGKILGIAENLPSVQLRRDNELMSWVQTAHPTFALPTENPASQFIGTRLNEVPSEEDPNIKIGFLMPLIDYMNHHPYGASYERTEYGAWRVPAIQSIAGSNECFLRYTNTDAHSIAFWHGYCETNTRHVASIQCKFEYGKIGIVDIKSTNAKRRAVNAPRYLPNESDLSLQDLVLEKKQVSALRTLLGLAVRSKRRDLAQPEAEIIANELIERLVEANIQKYMELQELCRKDMERYPLRVLFGQVAEHQLSLLHDLRSI